MRRDKAIALALIVVAAAPLVVATALYFGGFRPGGATNEGALLNPIWDGSVVEWRIAEDDPRLSDARLDRWYVITLDSNNRAEDLYLSRQVVTALGRESERMGRILLTTAALPANERAELALEHPGLVLAQADVEQIKAELIRRGAPEEIARSGGLVLADPLGNLVLVYNNKTGKQLLKDFKRLLKASKIG